MDINHHIQRAQHLMNVNRAHDALKEINAALALEPQNTHVLAMAAACYYGTGNYDRSMAFAREFVGSAPDNPHAHYLLAINFDQQEKRELARHHIQQALSLDPYDATYWAFVAGLSIKERNWEQVVKYAEKGLECDAENTHCLNYRNLALTKLGRTDALNAGIEESLGANPEDAHTHATIGWAKLELRQYKEARHHFAEALRLQPHNDWARSGMVEALKAKNILYRGFLMYFFWIAKHRSQSQWGIILVIYFSTRLLRFAANSAPILYLPYIILLFAAYLTWIIEPVFNLFVLADRYGRYLLTRREKTGALLVGTGVLAAIALGVGFWLMGQEYMVFPALYFATIVIPVGSFFSLDDDSRNLKIVGIYTIVLAVLGAAALGFIYTSGSQIMGILYLIGVWTFGWVANYLNSR